MTTQPIQLVTLTGSPQISSPSTASLHPASPTPLNANTSSITATTNSTGIHASSASASTLSTTITTPSPTQLTSPTTTQPYSQNTTTNPSFPTTPGSAPSLGDFSRNRYSVFKFWLKPGLSLVVYGVTLYVASSASKRYTLLGRVSATLGTWFLAILAKAGDLVFAFAVADTLDCLAWGALRKRRRQNGPERLGTVRLDWFVALASSTGVIGLIRILLRNMTGLCPGRGTRGPRELWRYSRTTRWSLSRLLLLIIFIPGPGIILLADIEQKDVFFEIHSIDISGGLAIYDPDLATASAISVGPDISRLAQMMLRDRSVSWPVDPVDPACKSSSTCSSYLIAGPHRTVDPWPFTAENGTADGFRLHNAPFYQVDMWNVESESQLLFNETTECELYGGFQAKFEYSMRICMREYAGDTLITGWKSCQSGYDNATNQCLDPASSPEGRLGWTTYLHFYRRHATVVFSRSLFTILDVSKLTTPQSQTISAASLFSAINAMLYRPNQLTNDFHYDQKSQPYILTQVIGQGLWYSLHNSSNGLMIGKSWLRNVLTLPVYLFQPTVIGTGENVYDSQENGTAPLLKLPDENYIRGSYCIVDKRSIPGVETIIGYACVAGFLLLFVVLAKWSAFRCPAVEPSEFPLLDYEALTCVVDDRGRPVNLREKFSPNGNMYGDKGLVLEMDRLRVGMRAM